MSPATSEWDALLSATPFLDGGYAGGSPDWHRWLWALASIRGDRATWTRAAVAAARLLLPYYEQAFRGDPRPRTAVDAAQGLVGRDTSDARKAAKWLLWRVGRIRSGGGVADAAARVAGWALRTALATHTAPKEGLPPAYYLWSRQMPRDEGDWTYCSFMALTYAAHAVAHAVRQERRPYPPKWRFAYDEGKLRVQATLRRELADQV